MQPDTTPKHLHRYADWKAPQADGQVLVWPEPERLLQDTRDNRRRLDGMHELRFAGRGVPELRAEMRAFLGFTPDTTVVATGHQAELYHPGVWAKSALVDAVARRLSAAGPAQAVHVAVDTDAPKHLHLRWPGTSMPLSDDERLDQHDWLNLAAPPTPGHVQALEQVLMDAEAGWSFSPMLPQVLAEMRRLSMDRADVPSMIVNATHSLDWDLGLRQHAVLLTPLLETAGWGCFLLHVMANAESFCSHYNAALAAYRREAGITSPTRPMPDLAGDGAGIELPFWLDDLAEGRRSRPRLRRSGEGWQLRLGEETFDVPASDDADLSHVQALQLLLRRTRHRLAPRALTLTTFLRLLVCDQFVHGIGGGRYDQVTDRIMAGFFGIDPPRFAVATATLFFPEALGRERVCMPCLKREGHRLQHAVLGGRKREIALAIEHAPRHGRERAKLFAQMHAELDEAAADSPALADWQQRIRHARTRLQEEQALFNRELFYALQPKPRLAGIIRQYREAFDVQQPEGT